MQKTPIPLIVLSVPTFRTRSGFFSKTWTNSVTSHLSPPQDVSGWGSFSDWSRLAWPGTGKVSLEIWSHFWKAPENHCALVKGGHQVQAGENGYL